MQTTMTSSAWLLTWWLWYFSFFLSLKKKFFFFSFKFSRLSQMPRHLTCSPPNRIQRTSLNIWGRLVRRLLLPSLPQGVLVRSLLAFPILSTRSYSDNLFLPSLLASNQNQRFQPQNNQNQNKSRGEGVSVLTWILIFLVVGFVFVAGFIFIRTQTRKNNKRFWREKSKWRIQNDSNAKEWALAV